MNIQTAKKIGSRQAVISVVTGLLIAQALMMQFFWSSGFLDALLWFREVDFTGNILAGIVLFFLCGYFFGQLSGVEILIRKKNPYWTGIKYGFLTLFTSVFLSSWIGFFQEGVDNIGSADNPFEDYIFKPVYWVMLFGLPPAILVGSWFGKQIEKKGRKAQPSL